MFLYQKFPVFKEFRFLHSGAEKGELFSFSSELENIGVKNDVSIQNGTYVEVISEPIMINRPKYGGDIYVVMIRADIAVDYHTIVKEFWVPTNLIVRVEKNTITNSQVSN